MVLQPNYERFRIRRAKMPRLIRTKVVGVELALAALYLSHINEPLVAAGKTETFQLSNGLRVPKSSATLM